jgi:hypothetical protein
MNDLLRKDQEVRPDLFFWFGPISRDVLDGWVAGQKLDLPEDLLIFWQKFGGGDLFETETIIGLFGPSESGDDLKSFNDFHRNQGLPPEYVLFHRGLYLSAVRQSDGRYVRLADDYSPLREYSSMDDWYSDLRSEYAGTYGLAVSR